LLQRDMSLSKPVEVAHPTGELEKTNAAAESVSCTVDTYAGKL
jgi:hypothetical protein